MSCNQTPCGDLFQPPSRNNMSFIAIIELVVMGAVSVICGMDLYHVLDTKGSNLGFKEILNVIDDVLIVAAIIYIIYGLFCACASDKLRMGIYLFALGGIIAMVLIILELNGNSRDSLLFLILKFCIIFLLTWILWNQAARV